MSHPWCECIYKHILAQPMLLMVKKQMSLFISIYLMRNINFATVQFSIRRTHFPRRLPTRTVAGRTNACIFLILLAKSNKQNTGICNDGKVRPMSPLNANNSNRSIDHVYLQLISFRCGEPLDLPRCNFKIGKGDLQSSPLEACNC